MKFVIKRSAEQGDIVFVHSHFIPAPGLAGLSVIDVFRVEHDQIVEHWDVNEAVPEQTTSGREIA
jgi:predicted SnoaL-like aldol condensation-catalyzing enzyme